MKIAIYDKQNNQKRGYVYLYKNEILQVTTNQEKAHNYCIKPMNFAEIIAFILQQKYANYIFSLE